MDKAFIAKILSPCNLEEIYLEFIYTTLEDDLLSTEEKKDTLLASLQDALDPTLSIDLPSLVDSLLQPPAAEVFLKEDEKEIPVTQKSSTDPINPFGDLRNDLPAEFFSLDSVFNKPSKNQNQDDERKRHILNQFAYHVESTIEFDEEGKMRTNPGVQGKCFAESDLPLEGGNMNRIAGQQLLAAQREQMKKEAEKEKQKKALQKEKEKEKAEKEKQRLAKKERKPRG